VNNWSRSSRVLAVAAEASLRECIGPAIIILD